MLEHLVGPIATVSAQMTDKTYGAFSTIALALDFENRAVGTMLGSYDSSYAYPDTQRVEINGTEGRLVIHDTVRALTFSRAGDDVERRWHSGYFDDEARYFAGTFDRHVDAILDAVRTGGAPPIHAGPAAAPCARPGRDRIPRDRQAHDSEPVTSSAVDDTAAAPTERCYHLPPEHIPVLADPDDVEYQAYKGVELARAARMLPDLVEAFRTGGAPPHQPWEPEGRAEFNRPTYLNLRPA